MSLVNSVLGLLNTEDLGGKFTKSNVRSGRITIPTWENEQLQVRETQPRNGQPPGIRISVRGEALGDLAKTDNGFGKLEFHLKLRDALRAGLADGLEVSYNDAPRGQGSSGYPTIYVNRAQASTAEFDPSTLVVEAKQAGVPANQVLDAISSGDYTKLRALIAFHTATGTDIPDPDETEGVDEDGDSFPA